MKKVFAALTTALLATAVFAERIPHGTAGDADFRRPPHMRQLSLGMRSTRVPVNWTGCGVAKIDGVLSPGEWSGAATQLITINGPTGPVTGTLYVMNDNLNLYIALKYPETAANYGSLGIEFDNNNNGVPFEEGDEAYVANNQLGFFDDFRTMLPPCPAGEVCGLQDTDAGGTVDGSSAYVNDGTWSVYETSHLLMSNDTGHDFFLNPTSTVGFFIMVRIIDSGGTIHDTFYPDLTVYDQITIGKCTPPPLGGCGTPTLDGVISGSEWATAGQFRLSVATPHSGYTPATLYVMNDSFSLYTALAFDQSSPLAGNGFEMEYDANGDGLRSLGDDAVLFNAGSTFYDYVGTACGGLVCYDFDTSHGGTNDGAGAFGNDGIRSAFEISHPLSSGDIDDMSIGFGSSMVIGFFNRMIEAGGTYPHGYGDTTMNFFWGLKALICDPGPVAAIADIHRRIDSLVSAKALTQKNADALLKDLNRAGDALNAGKNKQAASDFGNFISDVKKMVRKGDLSDRQGQPLISAANNAMSQL